MFYRFCHVTANAECSNSRSKLRTRARLQHGHEHTHTQCTWHKSQDTCTQWHTHNAHQSCMHAASFNSLTSCLVVEVWVWPVREHWWAWVLTMHECWFMDSMHAWSCNSHVHDFIFNWNPRMLVDLGLICLTSRERPFIWPMAQVKAAV